MNAISSTVDMEFLHTLSVLYVEDEEAVREELAHYLRRRCPRLTIARNGQEGLELFKTNRFDVVVTDVKMPVMDGLEMAQRIKSMEKEVPVIIVTAYNEVDYFLRAIDVGVDSYVKKPIDPAELVSAVYKSTIVRFHQRELARKRQCAFDTVEAALIELAQAVDRRSPPANGHQNRVGQLATEIANELGLDPDVVEGIQLGASIHDIGVLHGPLDLLCAPRKLSVEEFERIKVHAQAGAGILAGIQFPWPITDIIRQHHERLDGSGYPLGLRGDDILLESRIVAVADVVEAMISERPYRSALGIAAAVAELQGNAGKLYDRSVVESCIRVIDKTQLAFWDALAVGK